MVHLIITDTSVSLETRLLVKFIRNYIWDPSDVFSISSLVTILMTSFSAFSRLFIQTVGEKMATDRFINIIKRKLLSGLKINQTTIVIFAYETREI